MLRIPTLSDVTQSQEKKLKLNSQRDYLTLVFETLAMVNMSRISIMRIMAFIDTTNKMNASIP